MFAYGLCIKSKFTYGLMTVSTVREFLSTLYHFLSMLHSSNFSVDPWAARYAVFLSRGTALKETIQVTRFAILLEEQGARVGTTRSSHGCDWDPIISHQWNAFLLHLCYAYKDQMTFILSQRETIVTAGVSVRREGLRLTAIDRDRDRMIYIGLNSTALNDLTSRRSASVTFSLVVATYVCHLSNFPLSTISFYVCVV